MKTILEEKFNKVYQIFENPERWCQNVAYKDSLGYITEEEEEACTCCLVGGINLIYPITKRDKMLKEIRKELALTNPTPIIWFNDSSNTKLKDVYDVCKKLNI